MSFFELLVIFIVVVFVVKPDDLPGIIKKFKNIKQFIATTKKDVANYLDPEHNNISPPPPLLDQQSEQMNFYLEKIADLSGEYKGDYSLDSVKEHYRILMNQKINSTLKKK